MRIITSIIVHSTATPEGKPFTAADIDKWHKSRGFRCIGYHFVVRLDGTIERGRPLNEIGAHCRGYNYASVGVVYVGGVGGDGKPQDTRTNAQKKALQVLLSYLLYLCPGAAIFGHRDKAATACPSFFASAEYQDLRPMAYSEDVVRLLDCVQNGMPYCVE